VRLTVQGSHESTEVDRHVVPSPTIEGQKNPLPTNHDHLFAAGVEESCAANVDRPGLATASGAELSPYLTHNRHGVAGQLRDLVKPAFRD